MASRETSWHYIDEKLNEICNYYNVSLPDNILYKLSNELINRIHDNAREYLPRRYYAKCVDGTIRYGRLGETGIITILALRGNIESERISNNDYENVLLSIDDPIVFCEETGLFYMGIEPVVGKYIMKHGLSSRIIDIILGNSILQTPMVYIPETLNLYLKQEKSIHIKKQLMVDESKPGFTSKEIRNVYFPLEYITRLVMNSHMDLSVYELLESQGETIDYLSRICKDKDLPFYETLERMQNGYILQDAIKEITEEKEKYGFIYDVDTASHYYEIAGKEVRLPAKNYNFYRYLKYVAELEENEQKEREDK